MGCLTAPSHRSVRMKFVVILCFLLLGVVLGDPRRYGGRVGYGGDRGGYYGGRVYGYHGKRSADADAAPVADAYRGLDMEDIMAVGTGAIVHTVDTVITAKEMLILSPT